MQGYSFRPVLIRLVAVAAYEELIHFLRAHCQLTALSRYLPSNLHIGQVLQYMADRATLPLVFGRLFCIKYLFSPCCKTREQPLLWPKKGLNETFGLRQAFITKPSICPGCTCSGCNSFCCSVSSPVGAESQFTMVFPPQLVVMKLG